MSGREGGLAVRRRKARSPLNVKHGLLIAALVVVGAVGLDLAVLAYHDLQDVYGGADLTRVESTTAPAPASPADERFLALASQLTFTPVTTGNGISLATTGAATFPHLWADMRSARRTLTVQQYYCGPGRVADSLKAVLTERARAGVRVLFLWDGFGCKNLGEDYFRALHAAGVEVAPFRRVHWYSLHRTQHRSHLRVVVVDGTIGWVGGAGFDDKWWTGADGDPPWRDTNVRFTGPAVRTLQAAFAAGWAETTGRVLAGEGFFPWPVPQGGSATAGIIYSVPVFGATAAERYLAVTSDAARRRLWITNPYFLPSEGLRSVLKQAARRGVDVRVLTAGDKIDVPILRDASRSYYEELLRAGVHIYEYVPAMIHAKTLVADSSWSTIGTLNFDERSLRLNEEATLLVSDPGTAAALDSIFRDDLRHAREIRLPEFQRRSWFTKLREKACRVLTPFL